MNVPKFNYKNKKIFCQIHKTKKPQKPLPPKNQKKPQQTNKKKTTKKIPDPFFCLNIYSGKFDFHHLLFLQRYPVANLLLHPPAETGCCHIWQGQAPNLQSLCVFWTFWWQTSVTEVSRTNDTHEDECTSNQGFAGSDPIIILLTQDHLTERTETFLCVGGINPPTVLKLLNK